MAVAIGAALSSCHPTFSYINECIGTCWQIHTTNISVFYSVYRFRHENEAICHYLIRVKLVKLLLILDIIISFMLFLCNNEWRYIIEEDYNVSMMMLCEMSVWIRIRGYLTGGIVYMGVLILLIWIYTFRLYGKTYSFRYLDKRQWQVKSLTSLSYHSIHIRIVSSYVCAMHSWLNYM